MGKTSEQTKKCASVFSGEHNKDINERRKKKGIQIKSFSNVEVLSVRASQQDHLRETIIFWQGQRAYVRGVAKSSIAWFLLMMAQYLMQISHARGHFRLTEPISRMRASHLRDTSAERESALPDLSQLSSTDSLTVLQRCRSLEEFKVVQEHLPASLPAGNDLGHLVS
eukprot:m.113865 g.113865  ORF g.113865 m.113865 type:complete len:168 (-) comp22900_c0_seq1:2613-3116(-)